MTVALSGQVDVGCHSAFLFSCEEDPLPSRHAKAMDGNKGKQESENRRNCLETRRSPALFPGGVLGRQSSKCPVRPVIPAGLSATEPLPTKLTHACPCPPSSSPSPWLSAASPGVSPDPAGPEASQGEGSLYLTSPLSWPPLTPSRA